MSEISLVTLCVYVLRYFLHHIASTHRHSSCHNSLVSLLTLCLFESQVSNSSHVDLETSHLKTISDTFLDILAPHHEVFPERLSHILLVILAFLSFQFLESNLGFAQWLHLRSPVMGLILPDRISDSRSRASCFISWERNHLTSLIPT